MIKSHVRVYGIVQGVCFRAVTEETATNLGLTGWVRNRRDGSVEVVFEGEARAVEAAVKWCGEGPPASRVDRVDVERTDYTGEFDSFGVKLTE